MPRGPESSSQDHYAALGVAHDADARAIKKRYRQHARELHPVVNADPNAQERFKEVATAYEVLSDPQKKAGYDKSLNQKRNISDHNFSQDVYVQDWLAEGDAWLAEGDAR